MYGGVFYAPHAMSFALAGLSFPIEIDSLAYGLSHPNVKLSAEVLKKFNIKNALVYSSTYDGIHYLDELLPIGCVNLTRIKDSHVEKTISADIQEALNLESSFNISKIKERNDKINNVLSSLKILKGEGNESQRDAICINASIFLLLAGKVNSMEEGYNTAKQVLNSGKVWNDFLAVINLYNGNSKKITELVNNYNDI